jgi:hypothetical protein
VDEDVELPVEGLAGLLDDAGAVVVGADVALGDERARDGLRELPDALLDALALVGEGELGALLGEPLRDRPCDLPLVGDSEHEAALAFESAHGAILTGG